MREETWVSIIASPFWAITGWFFGYPKERKQKAYEKGYLHGKKAREGHYYAQIRAMNRTIERLSHEVKVLRSYPESTPFQASQKRQMVQHILQQNRAKLEQLRQEQFRQTQQRAVGLGLADLFKLMV